MLNCNVELWNEYHVNTSAVLRSRSFFSCFRLRALTSDPDPAPDLQVAFKNMLHASKQAPNTDNFD